VGHTPTEAPGIGWWPLAMLTTYLVVLAQYLGQQVPAVRRIRRDKAARKPAWATFAASGMLAS